MRILNFNGGQINIYDERNSKHNLPHCHVIFNDGRAYSVALFSGQVLTSNTKKKLPRSVKKVINQKRDLLINEWGKLNN
jgi:hypothetical protein